MRILLILVATSSLAVADNFTFKKNSNPPEKHEKVCLNQSMPKHRANFEFSELCEFGQSGCNGVRSKESFEVFCDLSRVTDCYSNKAWKTRNQYFNLSSSVTVSNISNQIKYSNGAKTNTICAHYK